MKKIAVNPFRLIFQIIIFCLIVYMGIRFFAGRNYTPDFESYCPYGGIQAFASFLVNKSLACSMTSVQIAMGGILIIAVILFSKLFCSFICPVGTISEWLGALGDKMRIRQTITGVNDKIFRMAKYALLFITIYFSVTTSELFCKWFCPYFAVASGFNSDVNVIMGASAIVIVVLGSVFVRLLWCKYLCPFSALSNIFRYFPIFAGLVIIYAVIRAAGVELSFIWLAAAICILAGVMEIISLKTFPGPLFRIIRNPDLCTSCKKCSVACPQAIDVFSNRSVDHIDCHLCADCMHVCLEKGALGINKKGKKWLPAAALVILIVTGLAAGKTFELPTINQYWAEAGTKQQMKVFSRPGLNSIKCYGSSVAFANQMYNMDGVYGVATFVGRKTAKIWYDPTVIDTVKILKYIFTPARIQIRELKPETVNLKVFDLRVDNFLDPTDTETLAQLLSMNADVYGFLSEFDCPVRIKVFADAGSSVDETTLTRLVEQKNIEHSKDNTMPAIPNNKFKVTRIVREPDPVDSSEFSRLINN